MKGQDKGLAAGGTIRWNELRGIVQVDRTTVWRWEKSGRFPKRIKLGDNSVAWYRAEIDEWFRNRDKLRAA